MVINRTDDVVLRHGVTSDETELPCVDVGLVFAREGRQNGRRLWKREARIETRSRARKAGSGKRTGKGGRKMGGGGMHVIFQARDARTR